MGYTWFRIPPALSSVLAVLVMLQLRAVGILNHVDPLVSSSNYYLCTLTLIVILWLVIHVIALLIVRYTIAQELDELHSFELLSALLQLRGGKMKIIQRYEVRKCNHYILLVKLLSYIESVVAL